MPSGPVVSAEQARQASVRQRRFDSRGKRVKVPAVSETAHRPTTLTEPPTLEGLRRLLLPFCRRHPIARLEAFGSVADRIAIPASDVDLMVTFDPGVRVGKEFFTMALELEDLLGRRVDLVERASVERMANPFKRRSILSSAQLIYAK